MVNTSWNSVARYMIVTLTQIFRHGNSLSKSLIKEKEVEGGGLAVSFSLLISKFVLREKGALKGVQPLEHW